MNVKSTIRLALISSPRSGNTWLRLMLGEIFNLSHFAVHSPDELSWAELPNRCIVQLHWPRTPEFLALLKTHKFQTISIARHPLDLLLSILNFSQHAPQTALWLKGLGGDESTILGKDPTSSEFLNYALSKRVEHLLNITPDWWGCADAIIKYEDLVSDTAIELKRLSGELSQENIDVDSAIEKYTFENLRATSSNQHYWKGMPGLWERYIPGNNAREIYAYHHAVFEKLKYDIHFSELSTHDCLAQWQKDTRS